jgi:hypothetical protein
MQVSSGLQQQLLVGCAWMAAGAVGARICGATRRVATAAAPALAAAVGGGGPIRDHDLLRCASIFLLGRTGRSPSGVELLHVELGSALAADVEAYGACGRRQVLDVLKARASTFPTTILSVTASAPDASVRVDYHDGSGETLCCTRGPKQQVLVRQVLTHREAPEQPTATATSSASAASAASAEASDRGASRTAAGVELLWWALRFLHADISRDYAAQRRYLAPDAAAFGAVGREEILAANGETLPEDEKTVYTVPNPITVDPSAGTHIHYVLCTHTYTYRSHRCDRLVLNATATGLHGVCVCVCVCVCARVQSRGRTQGPLC